MRKKVIDIGQIRETAMLRRALKDMAQQEIRAALRDETLDADYERTLSGVQAHMAQKTAARPRPRRSLRVAAVLAAVMVVFSGACLASEEIRGNLFRFVETQLGRYREVKMYYEGSEDEEYASGIAADDPRLAYVWEEWPLHYYPLYLPGDYLTGERCFMWEGQPGAEMTEEERVYADALIAADLATIELYSANPDERNYIMFGESGQKNFKADFEAETNEIIEKTIAGRDVIIVKIAGSFRCYWQQDDHILTLTTTGIAQDEMEKIIAGVERIR